VWPMVTGALVLVVVAAGAAAAIETDTVDSYWRGLWWAIGLITTVGFIGSPPTTDAGAALSVFLMVVGFLLLAMVSASLAALFVREDEEPYEAKEASSEAEILAAIRGLEARLAAIESRLPALGASGSSDAPGEPDAPAAPERSR
jgi:hypothetical protein